MILAEFDVCKEYVKNLLTEKQRQSYSLDVKDEKKI